MKKIIFIAILLLYSINNFSQNSDVFKLTFEGVNSVVVTVEGKTAKEIYDSAKLYIAKNYKRPESIIMADTPEKILRFKGYKSFDTGVWSAGTFSYVCDLEFKDGKYKISYIDLSSTGSPGYTPRQLYNNKGELRKYEFHKQVHKNFEDALNNNHENLKAFILSASEEW